MKDLALTWLKMAAIEFINHPVPRYIIGFALITGCLFTVIPLMNFSTGFQVGLIMGAYQCLATRGLKE